MDKKCSTCYIGIGSNLDGPRQQVLAALACLDSIDCCELVQCSSLYATKPLGFAEQPDFVNAVCELATTLDPHQLLAELLDIEARMGRVRFGIPNQPRCIDLDLLLYSTQQIETPNLVIPHPRMHERRFVLEPLIEVARYAVIPGKGSALDLFETCFTQEVVRVENDS